MEEVQFEMPRSISVVLASNDSRLLDQARSGLGPEKAIKIVGEAREGGQAVRLAGQRRPTLLLVDLDLPPSGGLPVLAQVRRRSPKTRMLAIDSQLDERRVLRVAKTGAHGYMLGEAIPAYLAKAARVMAAGEVWLSRRLTTRVVEELQRLARIQERAERRRGR